MNTQTQPTRRSTIEVTYVEGDATSPKGDRPAIIVHICNDVGGWGRGFVLAISDRWREPELKYRAWHREGREGGFELGGARLVQVEPDLWVANMIAQRGTQPRKGKPPIRYQAVEECLTIVAAFAVEHGASVHMPRIGCGLAGGKWDEIEPIIERTLLATDVAVTVYDYL